jgi:hypothetical protein
MYVSSGVGGHTGDSKTHSMAYFHLLGACREDYPGTHASAMTPPQKHTNPEPINTKKKKKKKRDSLHQTFPPAPAILANNNNNNKTSNNKHLQHFRVL